MTRSEAHSNVRPEPGRREPGQDARAASADDDRLEGAGDRDAGAGDQPAEHVAAEVVGAEQVRAARALQHPGRVLRQRVVRRERAAGDHEDGHAEQDDDREPGRRHGPDPAEGAHRAPPGWPARRETGLRAVCTALTTMLAISTTTTVTSRVPRMTGTSPCSAPTEGELGDARQVEELLGDDRAADDRRHGHPEDGQRRPRGVAQHVSEQDPAAREAAHLGAGDVVLAQRPDQRGAELAGEGAGGVEAERDRRQDREPQPLDRVLLERHVAAGRQRPELHREDDDQHDADHERRQRRDGRADER